MMPAELLPQLRDSLIAVPRKQQRTMSAHREGAGRRAARPASGPDMDEESTTVAEELPGADPVGDATDKFAQIDTALEQVGRLCTRLEQAEQRFKQMTDECAGVLDGLVTVDRRHATTLATLNERLGDWCNIERKLLEESARRIEVFERGVEHEWTALRRLHEEPIADMKEQAERLRSSCLDAARLARQRLEAAEQGYTLQAADLERRMAEWTRRVLSAARGNRAITDGSLDTGDARAELASSGMASVEPWPLEGVAHLHQELRAGSPGSRPRYSQPGRRGADDEKQREKSDAATAGQAAPEPDSTAGTLASFDADRAARSRLLLVGSIVAAVVVVLVLVIYTIQMQRRLMELETKTQEATRQLQAGKATASAPAEAPVTDVQQAALRAGTMVDVLSAPDLLRYQLIGVGPGKGSYGQVLWSRSRGMALTATRLPAPPKGKVYRAWVAADGPAAPAGPLDIDAAGSGTLIVSGPLTFPRPNSITVTLESEDGAMEQPAGPAYLVRVQPG
jgi:hypothetical protein